MKIAVIGSGISGLSSAYYLSKKYEVKNYLKDHRIMAMCTIAALTFGGNWKIYDPESINTSFPSFLKILNESFKIKI